MNQRHDNLLNKLFLKSSFSLLAPRKALQRITMTFDALLDNLGELQRLKQFILEERIIEINSMAHSTRSATVSISSSIELSLKTSDTTCSKISAISKDTGNSPSVVEAQIKSPNSKKRDLNAHQVMNNTRMIAKSNW